MKREKHAKGSRSKSKPTKSSSVSAWIDKSETDNKRKVSSEIDEPLSVTIPSEKSKPLIAPARFKPESTLVSPVDTQPLPFVKPTTLRGRGAESKSRTSSTSSTSTQDSTLPKPKRSTESSANADPFELLKLATGIAPKTVSRRSSRERKNVVESLPKSPESSREASPVKAESPPRKRQAATKAAENINKLKSDAQPIAEILKDMAAASRAGNVSKSAVVKQEVPEKPEKGEKKPRQPKGRKRKSKSMDDSSQVS